MLTLRLASRNLLRNRRRALLTLLAIASGAAALIVNGGVIYNIFGGLREDAIRGRHGHLQLVRAGRANDPHGDRRLYALRRAEADSLDAWLSRLEGVEAVTPRLGFQGQVQIAGRVAACLGEGVVPADEPIFSSQVQRIAGRPLASDDERAVLLGRGLAERLDARPGDAAILFAMTPDGGWNALEVEVAGTFEGGLKAFDDWVLKIPVRAAHALLLWERYERLVVMLDDTRTTGSMAAALADSFAARGVPVEVRRWEELALFHNQVTALFRRELDVIKVIISSLVILSIANTMSMAVLERRREIGTVLAMGATPGHVQREFLAEGGLLGLVGGACGVALGALIAAVVTRVGITFPSPPGSTRPYVGGCDFVPSVAATAWALAVASAVLAAWWAARRVSRLEVAEALRE